LEKFKTRKGEKKDREKKTTGGEGKKEKIQRVKNDISWGEGQVRDGVTLIGWTTTGHSSLAD